MTPEPLTPWPDGTEHAVLVTVNYEDVEYLLAQDSEGHRRQKSQSMLQYGTARGVDALLEVFAAEHVTASWFLPGRVAETQPASVRDIHAGGHEIGISGYAYEQLDGLSGDQQLELLRRACDAVGDVTGAHPTGFRLQRGDWPRGFAARLADLGFTWSSSLMGEDLPFLLPAGDDRSLVEVPRNYTCNDRTAFFWSYSPRFPPGQTRIGSYGATLQNWLAELRAGQAERLCTVLELHPEVIGTPGRRGLVSELLTSEPMSTGSWIPVGSELAAWSLEHLQGNSASHPVEVFLAATHRAVL